MGTVLRKPMSDSSPDIWPGDFTFCPHCGSKMAERRVAGRLRRACPSCGWVHYRNPGVGAAVLVRDGDGRVLLVRRRPGSTRAGRWCIPAGYVDYGEEIRAAAAREVLEEAGVAVEVGDVIEVASNFPDPARLTVGVWFSGTIIGGEPVAGDDADEVGWFPLDGLPDLAFETDAVVLLRLSGDG